MLQLVRTRAFQILCVLAPALHPLLYINHAHARLLDPSCAVAPEALEICKIVARAHRWPLTVTGSSNSALETLHVFAEQTFRRPEGSERLDDSSRAHYGQVLSPITMVERRRMAELFLSLGSIEAVAPINQPYDYILIHGSTVQTMRRRLHALANAVANDDVVITPQTQIVFLDGERPLFATETLDVLLNPSPYPKEPTFTPPAQQPKDERQAAELVFSQMWLPDALRFAPVHFVHAPADPGNSRAYTEGVVRYWLETTKPHAGRALMVSDNPFIDYQRMATILALLREHAPTIDIVAMGAAASFKTPTSDDALGVQLDNLARSLALALRLQHHCERTAQPKPNSIR